LSRAWRGSLTIGDRWAILESDIGENAPHAHLANQLTAGLNGPFVVSCNGQQTGVDRGQYALIPAGTLHAIEPQGRRIRSVYFDRMRWTVARSATPPTIRVMTMEASRLLSRCADERALRQWAQEVLGAQSQTLSRSAALDAALDRDPPPSSAGALAAALGISPSRQISAVAFGAPIARVLQWRQVQRAARALASSHSLAEAAEAGGFADQAHFTRRMRRWFGVAPGAGLLQLDIRIADPASDC
jgi:AraC-like DNA-binding protein